MTLNGRRQGSRQTQEQLMEASPSRALSPTMVTVLILGPVLMLVGRVLAVPYDDQDWDGVLTQAAEHQMRSDTGWLLALAACGLLSSSAGALAQVLTDVGRGSSAAIARITTSLGWAGAAGISVAGLIFSVMGSARDRAGQVQVLRELNAGSTQYVFLLCVVAAVGYAVLAVGLKRAGVLSRTGAVLLGLGGAGTLLCVPGPVAALAGAFALLLLSGHVLAIRGTGVAAGSSDEVAGLTLRT